MKFKNRGTLLCILKRWVINIRKVTTERCEDAEKVQAKKCFGVLQLLQTLQVAHFPACAVTRAQARTAGGKGEATGNSNSSANEQAEGDAEDGEGI